MALVQIRRGALPRRYGVKTTNYQYTERGQRQTLNYIYAETGTSITPFTSYKPTTDIAQVCKAGDPILFPMYRNGGIYPVEWQETFSTRTFNSGTPYEFQMTFIASCRAICNGEDIGGFNWGTYSIITEHVLAGLLDYHIPTGNGTSVSILDSNGRPTSQCYIDGARSLSSNGLHGFFKQAIFETIYDTPTSSHIEYVGEEQVEYTTSGLRGNPVVAAEAIVVAPYTCEVTLSYI